MVLKPFECQHSCPRMRVLSVYQVKARVVQSERQAGMAIAYRKFLIGGENIFEDKIGGITFHIFQQREKAESPTF